MSILFVGDINVDIMMGGLVSAPVPDREVTCRSFDIAMGSSAALAAATYAGLGGQALFAGLAGRDEYGDFMLREMAARGIDTRHVERTALARTGVTVNLIRRDTRTQITYPGTIALFDGQSITDPLLKRCRHVHFAGPYQQTRFRPRIAALLRRARRLGLTASMDPQWDACGRWSRMRSWLPLLDYLLPNADEARALTGCRSLIAAARWLAAHTGMPLIKDGRRGALLVQDGKVRRIPGYRVHVVDTTGAGDAFDAALLFARLDRGLPPPEAVRFAQAAAARSCRVAGGADGVGSEQDVLDFMRGREV